MSSSTAGAGAGAGAAVAAGAGPAAGPGVTTVLVLAKDPRPGFAKTRLTPPFSPRQAADLARAALSDTLDAVLWACAVDPTLRPLLVCDGVPGEWLPSGVPWAPQVSGDLDVRIAAAFDLVAGAPALLIGMDTPQLTPTLLIDTVDRLRRCDTVFGPATDGGWWALGMAAADGGLVRGIETSSERTGALQRKTLHGAGLGIDDLDMLTDVDTVADARAVARLVPDGRFGRLLAEFTRAAA